MKRKGLKITAIIVSVLIILIVALALGISSYAKKYIESHSKELIGRTILMKDLKLNIFTGTLRLDSVRMYEKDDKTVFASIDSFYMDLALTKLLSSAVEVTQLRVIGPYADIIQKGSVFNFDDLIPKDDTTKVEKKTSSFPKSILIKNIYIDGGNLVYTDKLIDNTIRMKDLGVAIPELAFERGNTKAGIHLKIGEKATLNSQLSMNMQTSEYQLKLKLGDLPVSIIKPYLKEYINLDQLAGTLSSDLLIKGNTNHVMEFTISGTANAHDFNLTNGLGEPIASAQEASVVIDRIYLPTSTYLFDEVSGKGVKLDFILHPATNNFTSLLKESKTAAASDSAAAPMSVKITNLHVSNSELLYTDRTLHASLFKLPISNIDFSVKDFNLSGTNKYDMTASVPNGGKINFSWKGDFNNLKNQEIVGDFRNISLKLFSPYCLDYTAYDITKGNMNFNTRNHIRNNYIQSINTIDAYDMSVGKKHKNMKVEYNVPLRLGLYILKDKDGKIGFDIPVKGSLDNPEFSYKKIIFKTIINLMVKVAVSPVRFLAGALGLNPDKMSSMDIDALQSGITAQQYSQLEELAGMYKKKPEMMLKLNQYVNWNEALDKSAIFRMKSSYLLAHAPAAKELPSYEEMEKMVSDDDENFQSYISNVLVAKGQTNATDLALKDKVYLVFPKDSIQSQLSHRLQTRNDEVKNYLIATGGVPQHNITVTTVAADTLMQYTGSDKYKIDMDFPDDN